MKRRLFLNISLVIVTGFLLITSILSSRVFDEKISSFQEFLMGLSPLYYITFYFVLLININSLYTKGTNKSSSKLYYILILAYIIYLPLLLFKYPFQTELYKQAEIFYLLKNDHIYSSDSFGATILATIFIEISSINPFSAILHLLPTLLYVFSIFSMFTSLYVLTDKIISSHMVLLFIGTFFVLLFTNRYGFAEPLYILFLFLIIKTYLQQHREWSLGFSITLILIFILLTITHIGFSTLALLLVTIIVSYGIVQNKNIAHNLSKPLACFVLIFISWNIMQWINITIGTYELVINFVDSLFRGLFEPRMFGSLSVGHAKQEYTTLTFIRSIIGASVLLYPYMLLFKLFKYHIRDIRPLHWCIPLVVFYTINVLFVVFGIGWITNSLRPYQFALTFSSFLIAIILYHFKLKSKISSKNLYILTMISLILIIYILWLPSITYVECPSRKMGLIKHMTIFIPYKSNVYGIGLLKADMPLFTVIFGNSSLFSKIDYLPINTFLNDMIIKNFTPPRDTLIFIDHSITFLESKYIVNPSLHVRLQKITLSLINDFNGNLIYSDAKYLLLYMHN